MKNANVKIVLNHPMVRVAESNGEYHLSIRLRSGAWVNQMPYPADQRGIIGALTLAIDVLAGKILLTGIESPAKDVPQHAALPGMLELTDGE